MQKPLVPTGLPTARQMLSVTVTRYLLDYSTLPQSRPQDPAWDIQGYDFTSASFCDPELPAEVSGFFK